MPKDMGADLDAAGADEGGIFRVDEGTGADDAGGFGVDDGFGATSSASSIRATFQARTSPPAAASDEREVFGVEEGAMRHAASTTPCAGVHVNMDKCSSSVISAFSFFSSFFPKVMVLDMGADMGR